MPKVLYDLKMAPVIKEEDFMFDQESTQIGGDTEVDSNMERGQIQKREEVEVIALKGRKGITPLNQQYQKPESEEEIVIEYTMDLELHENTHFATNYSNPTTKHLNPDCQFASQQSEQS